MNAGEPDSAQGFIQAMHTSDRAHIPKLPEKVDVTFENAHKATYAEVD
jgi:hypothetical protein